MLELLLIPAATCLLVAAMLGYFGQHVVARGVIFVDLALAQIAVLGTVVAAAFGVAPDSLAAQGVGLCFVAVAAALFALGRFEREGVPQEAMIGTAYAVAAATTMLVLSRDPRGHDVLESMLAGSILYASWADVGRMAMVYVFVAALHVVFQERFRQLSHHGPGTPKLAAWWDFLFYLSFGGVVVVTVQTIGVLLVFCYLVVPAVIAMLLTRQRRTRLLVGWLASGIVSVLGLWLSVSFDFPTGAVIVAVAGAALIAVATAVKLRFVRATV